MSFRERRERRRKERETTLRAWEARKRERRREEEELPQEEEAVERRRAWEATDHGRAQLALNAGETFFQVQRVISVTNAEVEIMMGASSVSEDADRSSQGVAGFMSKERRAAANAIGNLPITQTLAALDEMGWHLIHVGYTYRATYAESRDKFLASGQQIATAGEIVAIYLFRRNSARADG